MLNLLNSIKKCSIQLSEEILESQICSVCKKYLSYPPTKVFLNGEIKCGRCSNEKDLGVISTFDKLAESFLFPCVNSYEGCLHWLGCTEVPQHEETCKGGLYKCPICPEDTSKPESALCLIHHLKINHKKFFLDNPVLQIIREEGIKQHYFYHNLQLKLFALIFVQINTNNLFISVSAVVQKSESIKVRVKIYESYPKTVLFTSPWNACAPWNSNINGINFNFEKDLNNFCVAFEFQNPSCMIRYVTNRPETNVLEKQEETHVSVVKIGAKKMKLTLTKSNGDNLLSENSSLLESQTPSLAKTYKDHFWTEKDMIPKLDIDSLSDDDLLKQCPIYSKCGKFMVNKKGDPILDIRCSFCENYYVTICPCMSRCSISGCTYTLCHNCIKGPNVRRNFCGIHLSHSLAYAADHQGSSRNYFCRYSCGMSFSNSRLAEHEVCCIKNPFTTGGRFSDNGSFVRKYFDENYQVLNYLLSKKSIFYLIEIRFREGKIYVVDLQGYKYYINVKKTMPDNEYEFTIYHEYNPEKYEIIVRTCDNKTIKEMHNVLNFHLKDDDDTAFAIIFREVKLVGNKKEI